MFDFCSEEQATLHTLADKYLLASHQKQFQYEGFRENTLTKIILSTARFDDKKIKVFLMSFEIQKKPDNSIEIIKHLTSRECSVLQLLTQGNSQKQIAHLLSISQHTVGGHLKAIYLKLGVKSSTQASAFAIFKLGMRSVSTKS